MVTNKVQCLTILTLQGNMYNMQAPNYERPERALPNNE